MKGEQQRRTPTRLPFDLSSRRASLIAGFADFLGKQRWYGGKADTVLALEISACIPLASGLDAFLFLIRIQFGSGRLEQYALPLIALSPEESRDPGVDASRLLIIEPEGEAPGRVFSDALEDKRFAQFLLESIHDGISIQADEVQFVASPSPALRDLLNSSATPLEPSVMRVEQSNTSIKFDSKLILKFLRRVEEGVNLDVETGVFLAEHAHFKHTPPIAGSIEVQCAGRSPLTLAVLQGYVQNQGDAWKYTLHTLGEYFGRAASPIAPAAADLMPSKPLLQLVAEETPARARELIGPYLASAALLGQRTAELHRALSSDPSDPRFAPEPFTLNDRQSACESMENLAGQAFQLLEERLGFLEPPAREKCQRVLSRRQEVILRFRQLLALPITALRTRLHGDYHLGQVLYTGTDFMIIDFEGEPERPLAARRAKRSPLRDVAGMLRSFHYAERTALERSDPLPGQPASTSSLLLWGKYWRLWVSAQFMRGYLAAAGNAGFVPQSSPELRALLDIFLLEKAVYEVIYEIKNRPSWVMIPLDGILELL